jgi:hypothetical protein
MFPFDFAPLRSGRTEGSSPVRTELVEVRSRYGTVEWRLGITRMLLEYLGDLFPNGLTGCRKKSSVVALSAYLPG